MWQQRFSFFHTFHWLFNGRFWGFWSEGVPRVPGYEFLSFYSLGRHYVYAFKVRNNEDGRTLGRPNTDKQMEVGVPIVCTLGVMFETTHRHPPAPAFCSQTIWLHWLSFWQCVPTLCLSWVHVGHILCCIWWSIFARLDFSLAFIVSFNLVSWFWPISWS